MNELTFNKNALTAEEITALSGYIPGYAPTGDTITRKHTTYRGNKTFTETLVIFKPIDDESGEPLVLCK